MASVITRCGDEGVVLLFIGLGQLHAATVLAGGVVMVDGGGDVGAEKRCACGCDFTIGCLWGQLRWMVGRAGFMAHLGQWLEQQMLHRVWCEDGCAMRWLCDAMAV